MQNFSISIPFYSICKYHYAYHNLQVMPSEKNFRRHALECSSFLSTRGDFNRLYGVKNLELCFWGQPKDKLDYANFITLLISLKCTEDILLTCSTGKS